MFHKKETSSDVNLAEAQSRAVRLVPLADAAIWLSELDGIGGEFTRILTTTYDEARDAAQLHEDTELPLYGKPSPMHDLHSLANRYLEETKHGQGDVIVADIKLPMGISIGAIESQVFAAIQARHIEHVA